MDNQGEKQYWRSNGAIFIVIKSLKEVERILASMLREQRIVNKKLGEYFVKYPDKTDDSEEAMDEFADICERLWEIELNLSSSTRTAILMAVVDLESSVNQFCYFNLNGIVAEAIERLSLIEKLEVAHAVLNQSPFRGSRPFQAVHELVNWRNAFAHGKCTDMPFNTIKENHLKTPKKYPEPGDEVQEMLELLDHYLIVCKHLSKIKGILILLHIIAKAMRLRNCLMLFGLSILKMGELWVGFIKVLLRF